MKKYFSVTAEELAGMKPGELPREFAPASGLIYSSPATLTYNSPGAEGFGVKRAALLMPESALLLVSPSCCGRNTTVLAGPEYRDRMFYLNLDEKDLVTGRYLKAVPEAVRRLVDESAKKIRVVLICMTCVDALLGTDLPRLCRKTEEQVPGVRVLPSYMYALTREGTRPPMALIRQTLYSLLERGEVNPHAVNLMGYFAPLEDDSELYPMFRRAGLTKTCELARMKTLEEYREMGQVNFNLVLDQESRFAADDLLNRLGIPYVEISRQYGISRIARQYELLGAAVGVHFEDSKYREKAQTALDAFRGAHPELSIAVGMMLNANPFELSLMLLEEGWRVPCIFAAAREADLPYIRAISRLSPETEILMNTDVSMPAFVPDFPEVTLTLGKDAAYYFPGAAHAPFCSEVQPFGYAGLVKLLGEMEEALGNQGASGEGRDSFYQAAERGSGEFTWGYSRITPEATDVSGAVSVLYDKGGMIVILDAGGCTGNVCGFDLPEWRQDDGRTENESIIYSAGLRDLDAILGRDKVLLDKIGRALPHVAPAFLALIGTPVSSVIGTDLAALAKAAQRRYGIPAMAVPSTGMRPFEEGARMAREAYERMISGISGEE